MGKYDSFKQTLERLRLDATKKVRRQRLRNASKNSAFQEAFYDRLERREQAVFAWAMRQDKEELARLFACRWAVRKISDREVEFYATTSAMLSEVLLRVLKGKTHGVAAKLAKDPKQAVKGEALSLWVDWQTGRSLHKSGAAFHRFVVAKYPIIEDTKTVARWCKEWATQGYL